MDLWCSQAPWTFGSRWDAASSFKSLPTKSLETRLQHVLYSHTPPLKYPINQATAPTDPLWFHLLGVEVTESLLCVPKVGLDWGGRWGMGLLEQSSPRGTSCISMGWSKPESHPKSYPKWEQQWNRAVPPAEPHTVPGACSGQWAVTAAAEDAAEGLTPLTSGHC